MSNRQAIRLEGVTKHYPHFSLEEINLTLETGSVMGFIGPNGAGKSSTIRLIMGLIRAGQGQIEVLGQPMPEAMASVKWDIGFASEDLRLFRNGSLQWHIDFMRSIYPGFDRDYARTLLKRFDLRTDQKLKGFSHGQRVKAGLLLILARRPRLLILDEPTTGLDPVARKEVLSELMEVMMDEDRSILFSSHNTQDVEQLSDKITFIDRGRIIESQDKEAFLDKWRRIRFSVSDDFDMPRMDGVVESTLRGRLGVITTDRFDDGMTDQLGSCGAQVQAVEAMTLEEIFIAEVSASRAGEAA